MVLLVGDEMNRYESVSRDNRNGLVMHEGDFCWCLYCSCCCWLSLSGASRTTTSLLFARYFLVGLADVAHRHTLFSYACDMHGC